jgi:hypothetical protein
MPLDPNKLAEELKKISNFATEAEAVSAWSDAWDIYFQGATTNAIPVTPLSTAAAKAAMVAGLLGMSAPSGAALAIQNGIVNYWGGVVAAAPTIWPGAISATPPPGLVGISAALQIAFDKNTAEEASKEVSIDAIVAVLHLANLGGGTAWPGPATFPII